MSTQIPSEEHKSCIKSQTQTCVEGKVVNELFKNLTKNGKKRKEKQTQKENSPFKGEESGQMDRQSACIEREKQYANYTLYF